MISHLNESHLYVITASQLASKFRWLAVHCMFVCRFVFEGANAHFTIEVYFFERIHYVSMNRVMIWDLNAVGASLLVTQPALNAFLAGKFLAFTAFPRILDDVHANLANEVGVEWLLRALAWLDGVFFYLLTFKLKAWEKLINLFLIRLKLLVILKQRLRQIHIGG